MTDPSDSPSRTLRTVVLLENAPRGVAGALDVLMPDVAARLGDALLNSLNIDVNGVPMTFGVVPEPIVARELDYAASQSPLRDHVQSAVSRHRAHLVLSVDATADVFEASDLLANVTARYADDDNGLAVWLPDADHLTTSVMFAGEADQRPALTWFHTMAARLDERTAVAHTIGVRHLGGIEVQLRAAGMSPADAHRELRGAVATLLEQRTFPAPGTVVSIAGTPHTLTPASSIIGMGDVLDAVASENTSPPAPAPRRKGWFRRG